MDIRAINRLTTLQVKNAEPGKYADGGGQWFVSVTIHGRRREMGLGSAAHVSLKEARAEAEHWRTIARQGKDPIKERERQRRITTKPKRRRKASA